MSQRRQWKPREGEDSSMSAGGKTGAPEKKLSVRLRTLSKSKRTPVALSSNWYEVNLGPRQYCFRLAAYGSSINAYAGERFVSLK